MLSWVEHELFSNRRTKSPLGQEFSGDIDLSIYKALHCGDLFGQIHTKCELFLWLFRQESKASLPAHI